MDYAILILCAGELYRKIDSILMNIMNRRTFLLTATTIPLALIVTAKATKSEQVVTPQANLAKLEKASGGRLGVYALNTENGTQIDHRAKERFPLCSTFKVIAASAILARSTQIDGLLQQRIHYKPGDLVSYSPITEKHISEGMTVSELCAAALQYSDNTAGNLLINVLGGTSEVTAYARSIGDSEFRLDRRETDLNSAVPGDPRDTSTPATMAHSLQVLTLGDTLSISQRQQLNKWLRGNTTGAKRIRAAIPANWQIGDKTGSGDYGTANDIAVLWSSEHKPIILAIYYTQEKPDAKWRDDVLVEATEIVLSGFGLTSGVK